MATRAKFKLEKFEAPVTNVLNRETGKYEKDEVRIATFKPVHDSNPDSENGRFFAATPFGEIKMGVLNREAWSNFELDKEYYVDFTPAESQKA